MNRYDEMAPMASPMRVVLAKKIATSWSLNSTCIRQVVTMSIVLITACPKLDIIGLPESLNSTCIRRPLP